MYAGRRGCEWVRQSGVEAVKAGMGIVVLKWDQDFIRSAAFCEVFVRYNCVQWDIFTYLRSENRNILIQF